jgi:hypothetical protein
MKNQVKYLQNLFYDLLNDYGQVYIVIKHSPDSSIGNRGFTEEEKKKGLVLIFNRKNYKNLEWTEDGSIVTALGFGVNNKPEKCYLHSNDIMSIFSPDAKVRLDRWDMWDEAEKPVETGMIGGAAGAEKPLDEKIVSLDRFKKTKK